MRKSEAEFLLDHLEKEYDGPLELRVANLEEITGGAFRVPEGDQPFFVVGVPEVEGEGDRRRSRTRWVGESREVMAWSESENRWLVQRVRQWEVSSQSFEQSMEEVYIFDTRRREFVPLQEFRLPPNTL